MRLTAKIGAVACLFALAAACRPSTARADVDWTLSGVTFSDGGTASGTFVTDDSGDFLSADITTTAGSTNPGITYDTATNTTIDNIGPNLLFLVLDTVVGNVVSSNLGITFDNPLTASNTPDQIALIGNSGSFENTLALGVLPHIRDITAGEAIAAGSMTTSVSEPMSAVLMCTGSVGLAFVRHRRHGKLRPA